VARTYRLSPFRRLVNRVVAPLTRTPLAPPHTYLLTVPGRRSGRLRSTPVTLIENGERWLVAPYGEVEWVKNARAAGEVTLSRRGRSERLRIEEATPEQAAPVLKRYLRMGSVVVRPFFEARRSAPLADFAAEAHRHPVFRLREYGRSVNVPEHR
jgi:deazaflavin-dependent oxidoreductase (nitroreductase family)